MRLGRTPHDPAAVAAAPSLAGHRFAAIEPAPTCDRSHYDYQPQLRHNDSLPTCTAAGLINAAVAAETLNTGAGLLVASDVELAFYAGAVGCPLTEEAIAATDGANVLTVLRRQSTLGFDIGSIAPLTADFATIPLVRSSIANAVARLSSAYIGIDIYERDVDTAPDDLWDDDGSDPGALVGGHLVVGWDYQGLGDTDTGRVATWGRLQAFTWRWMDRRIREAYALLWAQLQRADGTDWAGVDLAQLRADLAAWVA